MTETKLDRMFQRRDPASVWTSANPVLAAGELGIESDTNKLKIGDGVTAWNSLAYFGGSSFDPASPGPIGSTTPALGKFTTLEATAAINTTKFNGRNYSWPAAPGLAGFALVTDGAPGNLSWVPITAPSVAMQDAYDNGPAIVTSGDVGGIDITGDQYLSVAVEQGSTFSTTDNNIPILVSAGGGGVFVDSNGSDDTTFLYWGQGPGGIAGLGLHVKLGVDSISMLGETSGKFGWRVPGTITNYSLTLPDAAGAAGQVLVTDGPAGNLSWVTPAGGGSGSQVFTADGTFTVPDGVTLVNIVMIAGGSGAGGAGGGGGGGAGSAALAGTVGEPGPTGPWRVVRRIAVTPGDGIPVVVGLGGTGGAGGAGGVGDAVGNDGVAGSYGASGSASSFGAFTTAVGNPTSGGLGGAASGGSGLPGDDFPDGISPDDSGVYILGAAASPGAGGSGGNGGNGSSNSAPLQRSSPGGLGTDGTMPAGAPFQLLDALAGAPGGDESLVGNGGDGSAGSDGSLLAALDGSGVGGMTGIAGGGGGSGALGFAGGNGGNGGAGSDGAKGSVLVFW